MEERACWICGAGDFTPRLLAPAAGDVVVAADGRPIHLHLPPGEQRLDMVAAPLHVLQQEGQQRAAPLHGKLHLFHTITS